MDDRTIAAWRLANQALTGPRHPDAGAVVRSLLAVQAENADRSAWAVAARTVFPDRADLADRLDSGDVILTHVLRPTWHYVAAEDLVWLVEVTAPRIRPNLTRHLTSVDADLPATSRCSTGARAQVTEPLGDCCSGGPRRCRVGPAALAQGSGHETVSPRQAV